MPSHKYRHVWKKMSKSAALPFTIFRLGSRDFPLFIKLYSCVTDRWWHTEYDENIKIVGGKHHFLTKIVFLLSKTPPKYKTQYPFTHIVNWYCCASTSVIQVLKHINQRLQVILFSLHIVILVHIQKKVATAQKKSAIDQYIFSR